MLKQIFILILFLCCAHMQAAVEPVKTSLSHKIVGLNDSFSIVFSTHESINEKPDFTPLQEDFSILSNSQSHRTTMINGKVDQEISWTLALMAKKEGKLTIPSIQFGQQRSLPETIEVTAAAPKSRDDSIFLETEIVPNSEAYAQTQLIYKIRLYRSVNLAQASLSDLKVSDPDAIIERLGKDVEYEHFHSNGKRYVVLERKYAVFPQKAGELVFSPTVFEGSIIKGRSSFFDMQTQFMRASTDEQKIVVKPIPLPFQKHNWFAAKNVVLTGEWSADPSAVPLGEPLTLTLTLSADGCLGSQIPDIPLQLPSDVRQYADKPQVTNQAKDDGFVGVKQIKVALIPSKAGELTIPEISLKWWDLTSDQVKEAKLPATTIQVNEGAVAMNTPSDAQPAAPLQEHQEPEGRSAPLPYWVWFVMGLNGIWVVGLAYVLSKKMRPGPLSQLKQQLKKACTADNAKQAESALLAWAALVFPQEKPMNLVKLKHFVREPFQQALAELHEALYGKKAEWRGGALWQAFQAFKPPQQSQAKQKARMLKDLYPGHDVE